MLRRTAPLLLLGLWLGVSAPARGQTVVFAANGSGGSNDLSERLRDYGTAAGLPYTVYEVPWSRFGTAVADHRDLAGQYLAAGRLAHAVQCLRRDRPTCRVVFVGHSTGTHVLLLAAGMLPPGSIDRMILLSSSVSSWYDLQPALQATCKGIDVFYSTEDDLLALAETTVGSADRQPGPIAGRVGFCVPGPGPCPALRQYGWTDAYPGVGGHYVWTQPMSLQYAVIPLILAAR